MTEKTASVHWEGAGKQGHGAISTETGALTRYPYGFASRFEDDRTGTNPEEILAAAHAACFSMAFSFSAADAGFQVESLDTQARVRLVKQGVPARTVQEMSVAMGLPREQLMRAVGLARSTVERKIAARARLSEGESEKLVGLSRLIGQVDAMVRASGQAPAGFNAARWFAGWMAQPVAALGGLCPQELLDTADGREALATLLLQMQSGVYA